MGNTLYSKRFFPYYVRNILAGLDDEGKGIIYGYDPVGCMEKLGHAADGAGVAIMQPLLDNQVEKKRPTLEEAFGLVHDCFVAAAERQIHVADAIDIQIITKDGIEKRSVALRRD